MNKNKFKSYAQAARREFIEAVTERAHFYGIRANGSDPCEVKGDFAIINGNAFPSRVDKQRGALEEQVNRKGFSQVMEEIAYIWFNRFAAIRYMELHGFLSHGYRVLSHPAGNRIPEILEKAQHVEFAGLDKEEVIKLKMDGTRDEELYCKLIIAECNELSEAMPFLFERVQDHTELLLPDSLLHSDSIIRKLVNEIDEEDWQEVEIIGWLYQFYISEKKDEVIGKVVKSEDIPAATQLFTPNWIVKYMVQNSLGTQWMRTYPDSIIKSKMEYYIEPAEQTDEVNNKVKDITPETLNPEELTLLDPACGSGHILVEAYDLLQEIYLERGYRKRDIPELILIKNLFGLEIDDRAAQLAGFAVMMKARGDDRRIFDKKIQPNVVSIQESSDIKAEKEFIDLVNLFEHAKTYGSLIRVPEELADKLPELRKRIKEGKKGLNTQDLWTGSQYYEKLLSFLVQTEILSRKFDVVVANPPYMGNKYLNPLIKQFAKDEFKGYENDLFSSFIVRNRELAKEAGDLGFMSPFVWMFISSHEPLRTNIINSATLTSLIQLEYSGFAEATVPICTFTLNNKYLKDYEGSFIRLSDFKGADNQAPKTLEAIRNKKCGYFYCAKPDDFKKIPSLPIAYWLHKKIVERFSSRSLLGDLVPVRGGMTTANNDKFVRLWHEISLCKLTLPESEERSKWFPYNKGGEYRKWYGNRLWVVDWEHNGAGIKSTGRATVRSEELYLQEMVGWTDVTSFAQLGVRYYGCGFVFDASGPAIFPSNDITAVSILGYLGSKISSIILQALNSTLHVQAGNISSLPWVSNDLSSHPGTIVSSLINLSSKDWDSFETSWDFDGLPILLDSLKGITIEKSFSKWEKQSKSNIFKMKKLEEENNQIFIDSYGLQDELTPDVPDEEITLFANPKYRYGGKLTEEDQWTRFRQDTMEELISYAIGCMMGRYSLDQRGLVYAHTGNEGFDHNKYKTFPADDDGIVPITDQEWFDDDAACRFFRFIEIVWDKDKLEDNLEFVADAIGRRTNESSRDSIRRYFLNGFFKDHLKTYKKRPIYWMFTSGKERAFQTLVYLHRYNEGTLSRMRTEYVLPLQSKITTHMEHLEKDKDHASSTSAANKIQKEIGRLREQKEELIKFDENLHHYADKKITLDLDDGVKVNYGKFGDLLAEVKAVTGKKQK
jgi:type II restriction/modification system DNA methylase subunit YeeA